MEKRKTGTKRALIFSMIALIVCASLLIGTTYAWFSDSVANRGNRIQAGNLKVGFTAADTISDEGGDLTDVNLVDLADSESKLFILTNWAPGDTYTRYMKVKSIGSLDLKYNIDFELSGENNRLADAITLDVTPSTNAHLDEEASAIMPTQNPISVENGSGIAANAPNIKMGGTLISKSDFQIFKLEFKFLEGSGNTYNDETADFGLDVILTATQNNDKATVINARNTADFAKATANCTFVLQNNITLSSDVTISNLCNINLNGYNIIGNLSFVSQSIGTIDISGGDIIGTLTLNTPNVTVNHYNSVTNVNIIAVANNSYHENGTAEMITVAKGRVVAEIGATVELVKLADDAKLQDVTLVSNGGNVENTEGGIFVEVLPKDNIYTIKTANDFNWLAQAVKSGNTFEGNTVKLINDLDLMNADWMPIGHFAYGEGNQHPFMGTFIGDVNGSPARIYNLSLSGSAKKGFVRTGLFGYVVNSNISGITLESGTVTSDESYTGGIVGMANGGSIKNCINKVSVTGKYGGVGGIVGTTNDGTIVENCVNEGDIITNYQNVGGIVGSGEVSIINCTNSGKISFTGSTGNNIGGIVGNFSGGAITNCINTAEIKGQNAVGGIAGAISLTTSYEVDSAIAQCYNTGKIIVGANSRFSAIGGGIVGQVSNNIVKTTKITDCYNQGEINYAYAGEEQSPYNNVNKLGGIVGEAGSSSSSGIIKIENCYNTGVISLANIATKTTMSIGGILGNNGQEIYPTKVTNCYYLTLENATTEFGTSKTMEQLQIAAPNGDTYVNWSTDIWKFTEGEYPTF